MFKIEILRSLSLEMAFDFCNHNSQWILLVFDKKYKAPIFDLHYGDQFRSNFLLGANQIFDTAYLSNHDFVRNFERKFSDFVGSEDSCMVSSGTSALEILFRIFKVEGKKVIIPTNTFIATASACVIAGGIPELIDVNDEGQLSWQALRLINPTSIGAVVVIHLGGIILKDTLLIREWCHENNIPLIEDCAHAHGSAYNEISAGLIGDAGAFSFHLTKTITAGEGGAIVSKNPEIIQLAKSYRQFGKSFENELLYESFSGNHKMTEFQGLLGALDLERADERIKLRNRFHQIYLDRLSGDRRFRVLSHDPSSTCGYYKTIILSKVPRNTIKKALSENNVELTGGVYYYPLHMQPVMRKYSENRSFPNSDKFSERHFCPPCFPELTSETVHFICDCILKSKGDDGD